MQEIQSNTTKTKTETNCYRPLTLRNNPTQRSQNVGSNLNDTQF